MQMQTVFDTKPLLRPDQVESAKDEIRSLEEKLTNKHIEDKGEVQRQLRRARRDFESQVPKPPADAAEEDRMVKRSRQLLSEIIPGMCSQEEMRKAPPGAVDKHRAWEARNKTRILEWKHIMCRLTAGSGDRDAANLEKHRPRTSTLNMDNAFIAGKQIFLPDGNVERGVTFSDEQLAVLEQLSPEIRSKLASLDNPTRRKLKDAVEGIGLTVEPDAPPARNPARKAAPKKKERKPITPEQRQALIDRLALARAAKAKKQAA